MPDAEPDRNQEPLDFEGRRDWLSQPAVRTLLVSLACRRLGQSREAAEELVQDLSFGPLRIRAEMRHR